jgi:hypothetical protein
LVGWSQRPAKTFIQSTRGAQNIYFIKSRVACFSFNQLTVAIFLLGQACTKSHAEYTSTCSTGVEANAGVGVQFG